MTTPASSTSRHSGSATPARFTSLSAQILLALCAAPLALSAADGTWIRTNASATPWSLAGNWQDGVIADGIGASATFAASNTGSAREIQLVDTSRTLGAMAITYNRATSGTLAYTFSGTTGGLIFNNNGSGASLTLALGTNVTTHSTTISAGVQLADSLAVANNTTGLLTFSGIVSGSGGITKSGVGGLSLTGVNTYSGGTTINAGTVTINTDSSLGATTGAVSLNGGTLEAGASIASDAARGLSVGTGGGTIKSTSFLNWNGVVSGSGAITKTGANTLSFNNVNNTHSGGISVSEGTIRFRGGDGSFGAAGNGVTLASATTFLIQDTMTAGSGRTLTLSSGSVNFDIRNAVNWQGLVAGDGGLIKIGTAALSLSGANTYSGGTTINAGTIVINSDGNLGATTGAVTFGGGTLEIDSAIQSDAARSAVVGTGGGTIKTDAFLNWNGTVSGSGALTKTGTSTLSLNNVNNTHSGGILVNEGVIRFRNGDGSFGAAGNGVTFASGTTFLIFDAYTAGSGRTLTLSSGNVAFDIRNTFTWQGAITGAGGFTKNGASDLILAGTNDYSGNTALSVGRLFVNGSTASEITAGSGTTFGGTGSTTGSLTLNSGSTLAPGHDGIGTFTTSAGIALNSATYALEFNSTLGTFDLMVAGDVALSDATLTLTDLGSGALAPGAIFTIVENTGENSVSGAFLGLAEGDTLGAGGHNFTISYTGGTGNDITLTVASSAIPEPSTWSAIAGLAALGLACSRRRRAAR